MMGVTFNEAEFMQELEESMSAELEKVRRQIIRELSIIGERCINEARLKGSYTDHTGNLRSSVGYVIVEDGAAKGYDVLDSSELLARQLADKLIKN